MRELENVVAFLNKEGYRHVLTMPDGSLCGLYKMLYTTGLYVGLTRDSPGSRRYCYEHESDAINALYNWDGQGDPPGPWIKEKPSDRLGPGATA